MLLTSILAHVGHDHGFHHCIPGIIATAVVAAAASWITIRRRASKAKVRR